MVTAGHACLLMWNIIDYDLPVNEIPDDVRMCMCYFWKLFKYVLYDEFIYITFTVNILKIFSFSHKIEHILWYCVLLLQFVLNLFTCVV